MKLLKTLMATILTATALTAKAEEVPKDQASLIINAVIAQMKAQDAKCPLFKGDKLERSQEWADAHQVFVERDGTLIVIQRQHGDRVVMYMIQTKSDKKTIIDALGAVLNQSQESNDWTVDTKSVVYCDFTVTK